MYKLIAILAVWLCGLATCLSQDYTPQDLKALHKKLRMAKTDTQRITIWLELEKHHYMVSYHPDFPKSIDSAIYYVQKAETLSQTTGYKKGIGNVYIAWAEINKMTEHPDAARSFSNKAIDYFSKFGDKNDQANAYFSLADVMPEDKNIADKVSTYGKALKLYQEAGNKKEQAAMLVWIGIYEMGLMGNMQKGMEHLLEAREIYGAIGYERTQSVDCYIGIGYTHTGDFKKALEYLLLAIKAVEKTHDDSQEAAEVYNHAAAIYYKLKDYETAIGYFRSSYELYNMHGNKQQIVHVQCNLINSLLVLGREKEAVVMIADLDKNFYSFSSMYQITAMSTLITASLKVQDFKRAEKYYRKAIAISARYPDDDMRQNLLYPAIIEYQYKSKEFEGARAFVLKYQKLSQKIKNPTGIAKAHQFLFRLDSIQSKFDSALTHLKMEKAINDSLLNATKNQQISELQIKYDTEKKDKDLTVKEQANQLLKKQSELQQSKLLQTTLVKNISFGSLVLLAIIIALLYSRNRTKQKNNRILESQKNEINQKNSTLQKLVDEKEWLLKEIHHRVKNNLQMVMSLLNTQSHYLKDEAAMVAIRDSQHRIHSMSLIHKKLYQSDNVIAIHMEIYICELIEYFKKSFDTGQRIRFVTEIEPIELDTSQAVPVGLIINEALTNSIKHAFPNNSEGVITVILRQISGSMLELLIQDNGTGLPDHAVPSGNSSLGMKLINGLSTDLEATLCIENDNGLRISLEFPYDKKIIESHTDTLQNLQASSR